MNINEFNDDDLNELLDKLSKEDKTIFLLGDSNINLLNYDIHPPTNESLDSLSSHYFIPHILQPSRVTINSKTLIDNIFSNMAVHNIISGNYIGFLVAPNIFFNASYPKSNIYERDWPWITPGLRKSISVKNQFLSKFMKLKDPNKKGKPI